MSDDEDVPIRVDFRDAATARAWVEETRIKRPFRPRFFAAFCEALVASPKLRILELGSGPGQLAREILVHCDASTTSRSTSLQRFTRSLPSISASLHTRSRS